MKPKIVGRYKRFCGRKIIMWTAANHMHFYERPQNAIDSYLLWSSKNAN